MKEKELFKENCTVLEQNENIVLVSCENEKIVAKSNGKVAVGEKVNLFKIPYYSQVCEILIYLIPFFTFLLGFGFGFFFKDEIYHFVLVIGTTILGLAILVFVKFSIAKYPKNKYIIEKQNKIKAED